MIDWSAFKQQMQTHPQKLLGYVLGIAACFLVIWMAVVIQVDTSDQPLPAAQKDRLGSLHQSLNDITANSQAVQKTDTRSSSYSPFSQAWPTFLLLLAAIGGLWYWIRRKEYRTAGGDPSNPVCTAIGRQEVGHGHHLSVIRINKEYWVLGMNEHKMELLHRFSEEEWTGPAQPDMQAQQDSRNLFSSLLQQHQNKSNAKSPVNELE